MSIRARLGKIEQASQPKRPIPAPVVHFLTRDDITGAWTYDDQPVSDDDALAIARRQTHRHVLVIIRDQGDTSLGDLADITINRAYGNTA